jgi:hypothetical protein
MEIKFDGGEIGWAIRDLTSAVVVARLKEAVEDCKSFNKHPGDRKYNKKFSAACKLVIEHFGG